jgi:hypothetical protein
MADPTYPEPGPARWELTRRRSVRYLLPAPLSSVRAVAILMGGFALEGGTEIWQFLRRDSLGQGWLEYDATLITTILGFYLMFLGLREWHFFHPKAGRARRPPWRAVQLLGTAGAAFGSWWLRHSRRLRERYLAPMAAGVAAGTSAAVVATILVERPDVDATPRRIPWVGLGLWVGGTGATAALIVVEGAATAGGAPIWAAAPVGGVVVLAFGSFFLGLRREAARLGSPAANVAGWSAFAWSLGSATLAGFVIGERIFALLVQFFTNWTALIASIAPVVVAMSPLFVTYGLLIGAFWPSLSRSRAAPVDYARPLSG